MKYFTTLYLDKEKDIVLDFYEDKSHFYYVLRTPNHISGNLINNIAKVCNLKLSKDKNGLFVVKGKIPTVINEENKRIHILKFGGKTVAVINTRNEVSLRANIPAISKTLMSQTKDYKYPLDKTLVRTYIEEEYKFKTDLHTHMNANLHPDVLIALGIKHQIKYPLYFIKKLKLKLNHLQKKQLASIRKIVAKNTNTSGLSEKHKNRKIDDNTFINFADLILNNIKNADYNINKIRNSLTIFKDGQAVFSNLEKLYQYRYIFTKGIESEEKIILNNIEEIPDSDVKNYLIKMLNDNLNPQFASNSILEDKLLWVGRTYQAQGINYCEISNTTIVKNNNEMYDFLNTIHKILPLIEDETGVKIRFLAAIRRVPLTLIKDKQEPDGYLKENLAVLKTISKDPYIVGCDFVGEEINDVEELRPVINEIVKICKNDPFFTIRIHAGENDSLKKNVSGSIKCVKESLDKKQRMPLLRLGHGIYTPSLKTKEGKTLIRELKNNNVVLEFQLTSNVRLNNLNIIENHPLKEYLKNNVSVVQGTDGCGIYGTNSLDEQLALVNLLKIDRNEMAKIVATEKRIYENSCKSFNKKMQKFNEYLNGNTINEKLKQDIQSNYNDYTGLSLKKHNSLLSSLMLAKQIKSLPLDKYPIVLAGGSFNTDKRGVKLQNYEKSVIDQLLQKLNPKKFFFIIGHKLTGYEKYLLDNNKGFEIFSLVPANITQKEKNKIIKAGIPVIISTEISGMGTYKSFNYEIFARRNSTIIALDGNSPATNIIQEGKNSKTKTSIFISNNANFLKQKALSLGGYVNILKNDNDISKMIKTIKNNGHCI